MSGHLLFGSNGHLVYGSTSGRLLHKPFPSVTLSASSVSAFMGFSNDSGWTSAKYSAVRTDAWDDFKADPTLGGAGHQDLATGAAADYGYGAFVESRFRGLRFTFTLSSTQRSRLSSIDIASKYAAWWLKGYRYVFGVYRSVQDFLEVSGSINWRLGDSATPYDDGEDLTSATADKTVSWNDLNDDQVAADGTINDLQWVPYSVASGVVDRVRDHETTTLYLWAWPSGTQPQYLGDKSIEFLVEFHYGWEIVCGPVSGSMASPESPHLRLEIGQNA